MPGASLRQLTGDDFIFRHFMVDVTIHDGLQGNINFSTPGLPVIDFFLMLVELKREVLELGEATVETSQTQGTITAVREGSLVRLSYSFSPAVSVVSIDDFNNLPRAALNTAYGLLHSTYEELQNNEYLSGLRRIV